MVVFNCCFCLKHSWGHRNVPIGYKLKDFSHNFRNKCTPGSIHNLTLKKGPGGHRTCAALSAETQELSINLGALTYWFPAPWPSTQVRLFKMVEMP